MDKQSSKTILGSALLISALTVAAAYAIFFCYALSQNQAIEYEGPCLWASTQIARALNPYPLSPLSQSPYTVIIYPRSTLSSVHSLSMVSQTISAQADIHRSQSPYRCFLL
ncbi:MAG: hypothetical protein IPO31_26430 [Candidatus Obscuribacter sp.]|nr:hypothetical protein [Candidatus Obscuribacter sp.]